MTAPANFRAQTQLRALMAEHRYALVITHTSLAAFFTRLAAVSVRHRPAVVNVAHGYLFDDETPFLKRMCWCRQSASRRTGRICF